MRFEVWVGGIRAFESDSELDARILVDGNTVAEVKAEMEFGDPLMPDERPMATGVNVSGSAWSLERPKGAKQDLGDKRFDIVQPVVPPQDDEQMKELLETRKAPRDRSRTVEVLRGWMENRKWEQKWEQRYGKSRTPRSR